MTAKTPNLRRIQISALVLMIMLVFSIPSFGAEIPNGYLDKNNRVTILDDEAFLYFMNQIYNGNTYDGKYISLRGDFDLHGHAFNTNGGTFSGTLDGCGHTVSNFTVNGETAALIPELKNGDIKGLTITNETVTGTYSAGLVGQMSGVSSISNCDVQATVNGTYAAGITAKLMDGASCTILGTTSRGSVTGTERSGGIIASIGAIDEESLVEDSSNYATVSGGTEGTGGIIGYMNPILVNRCENNGAVQSGTYTGGIVGYQTADAGTTVENAGLIACTNNGTVAGATDNTSTAGGIAGTLTGTGGGITITDCINDGAVQAPQNGIAGGICGNLIGSTVQSCQNAAPVTGAIAGGIAGAVASTETYTGTVIDCAGGTGKITGTTIGRLIGAANGTAGKTTGSRLEGRSVLYLSIDDTNNDAYGALRTIGQTNSGSVLVQKGTLHGAPGIGADGGCLLFLDESAWANTPDGTTAALHAYKQNPDGKWVLQKTFSGIETTFPSTCYAAGTRIYHEIKTETEEGTEIGIDTRLPIQPAELTYQVDKSTGIITFNLAVNNGTMGNLLQKKTMENFRLRFNIPEGATFYGCDEQPNTNLLFFNINNPSQGCYAKIPEDTSEIEVTAHDLYRRDGSHNLYDGSDPAYPETDLIQRAINLSWSDQTLNNSIETVNFAIKVDDVSQINTILNQVTVEYGFDDLYDTVPKYSFRATAQNPKPTNGTISVVAKKEETTEDGVHTGIGINPNHPIQPVSLNCSKDSANGIASFTMSISNSTMGNLLQTTTLNNLRIQLDIPNGLTFYGCTEQKGTDLMFFNISNPSQGCYAKVPGGAKVVDFTAADLYRRDSDHNWYDGSNPLYPETSLATRAKNENWSTVAMNNANMTINFLVKADNPAELDDLVKQVAVEYGFDGHLYHSEIKRSAGSDTGTHEHEHLPGSSAARTGNHEPGAHHEAKNRKLIVSRLYRKQA